MHPFRGQPTAPLALQEAVKMAPTFGKSLGERSKTGATGPKTPHDRDVGLEAA